MNTQSKVLWQTNRAAVAYSFLANVAIFIGYGYMQKDLLIKIHKELFNTDLPQKDTLAYKMLESLGKLPNTYHMGEIKNFSIDQKQKIKKWYLEYIRTKMRNFSANSSI